MMCWIMNSALDARKYAALRLHGTIKHENRVITFLVDREDNVMSSIVPHRDNRHSVHLKAVQSIVAA